MQQLKQLNARYVWKSSDAIKEINGAYVITADHGNVELMMDEKNNQFTLNTQQT